MMDLLGLFFLLALLAWGLSQPLVLVAVRALAAFPAGAAVQARRAVWVAALPLLVPLASVTAMVLLAAAKAGGWLHDHCLYHAPHHPHFCFEHLPDILLSPGHWLLGAAVVAALAVLLFLRSRESRRQASHLALLTALSRGRGLLRTLSDSRPLAFAAGGLHPRIYCSHGLMEQLDRRERRMVVAHEAAHIRHRDLLVKRLMEWLLLAHVGPAAARLRSLWGNAVEARADDRVAARFGRTNTAALLLKLARGQSAAPPVNAVSGGDPAARIRRLLRAAPAPKVGGAVVDSLFWLALLAWVALLFTGHHALETGLGGLLSL